jgi:PAP2 superfamily protein
MVNLDLSWQQASAAAGGLAAAAWGLLHAGRRSGPRRSARLAAAGGFVRESALVVALFALWQLAGSFAVMGPDGALARARWLWHVERVLRMPDEAALQRIVLPHPLVVRAFDLYYDILHFPVLIACLVWLFVRHRERYGQFRNTLVAFTGICLLIQLIPVAPPRMLPVMVDTATLYGQSVYATGFDADQLSAMPSVHVGWAILVALAVIGAARSRWRWLAIAYPVMTMIAVVVTANHFWLDGVAAGAVLAVVLAAQAAVRRLGPHRDGGGIGDPTEQISSAACRASL